MKKFLLLFMLLSTLAVSKGFSQGMPPFFIAGDVTVTAGPPDIMHLWVRIGYPQSQTYYCNYHVYKYTQRIATKFPLTFRWVWTHVIYQVYVSPFQWDGYLDIELQPGEQVDATQSYIDEPVLAY